MSAIDVLNQPAAQAIGWALVHFVWQGTLIAAVTWAVLAALRRSAADVRYVVATIGLTLMLTMPAVTAMQAWRGVAGAAQTASTAAGAAGAAALPADPTASRQRIDSTAATVNAIAPREATVDAETVTLGTIVGRMRVEPWIPVFLFVWLCGVGVLTLRLVSGWLWVQRMKSHKAVPADQSWQQMAARLCRRLHISRTIRLLQSAAVEVPTVIGWMKPVILLPASALAGLSTTQLEAILAHELAHIRRHDYLVNLMQTVVETLLFYHPAVWWLSNRIRAERENCCDDLAVSLCGDPYTYASALADLEEIRGSRHALAIAASGGSLLHRVRRLLGAPTSHTGRAPGWLAGATAVLVMFGIAAGAVGHNALVTAADDQAVAAEPARPAQAPAAAVAVTSPTPAAVRPVPAIAAPIATARTADVPTTAEVTVVAAAPIAETTIHPAPAAALGVQPVASLPAATTHSVSPAPVAVASVATAPAMAAPVAAAASQDSVHILNDNGRRRGNHVWSMNGQKLEVSYEGDILFTDDDTDVKALSPLGWLKVSDGGWFGGRGVEFRADASGNITRRYRVGIVEKPFEPEGRAWLTQTLPRFIRQTALGASTRVGRILKAQGPAGVLAEISRIEGSWAKRVYFAELFKSAKLDAETVRQALVQAGREIGSDYELASLLISAQHLLTDEATRRAYFDAAATIQSDYELRRVLSAGLKGGPVSAAILASILSASVSLDSDYEQASLLIQIAKLQPIDGSAQRPFFAALDTISSPYEQGRVLNTLADRGDVSEDLAAAMLQSGARIRSDYEQAQFLLRVAKQRPIDGRLRAPFFLAVDGIKSSYDRGRVLQTVAKQPNTPAETMLSVIRSAQTITGHYERAQVLLTVAAGPQLSGTAREAYITAAEKLGDYEQGRVLAALVKNERGKR